MTPNKQTENGPVIQSDWLDYAELSKQCRAELNVPAGAPLVPSRFIMWLISKLNTHLSQPAVVVGYSKEQMEHCWEHAVDNHYNTIDYANKKEYIDSIKIEIRQGYTTLDLEKMWEKGIAHERYYEAEEQGKDISNEIVPQKCDQAINSLPAPRRLPTVEECLEWSNANPLASNTDFITFCQTPINK